MTIAQANEYLKLDDAQMSELEGYMARITADPVLTQYMEDAYREIYIEKKPYPELDEKYNRLIPDNAFDGHFYILVGLKNMEWLIGFFREHGISDDIFSHTMQDIAIFMRDRKSKTRRLNVPGTFWLSRDFSGELFRLGRMQFEMTYLREEGICGLKKGDPILEGHVPQGEPMDHDACWESYRRSFRFFEEHFGFSAKAVHLSTWMLDTALFDILPEESNIIKWAKDVTLFPDIMPGTIGRFLFGNVDFDPETAPRDTSLRRAVLDYIAKGGKFVNRAGIILRETIMAD